MRKLGEGARPAAVLRASCALAAILALAGIVLPLPTKARSIVVLIDASGSMGAESVESSRAAALALVRSLERRDRVGVVAFAAKPVVLARLGPPERIASILASVRIEAPSPESTDLSAALAAALALAKEGGGERSIYLFSDGRATAGGPPAGRELARSGVTVNVVAAGRPAAGLVSEGLSVPETVLPGERVLALWRLRSETAGKIDYALSVDGKLESQGVATLAEGVNEIALEIRAGTGGRRRIEIEAFREGQPLTEAGAGAFLSVGRAARVLVASGEAGQRRSPAAHALAAQGFAVDAGDARILPDAASDYAGVSAVVLDNVSALEMTGRQQTALREYVGGGGGLLVIGGESSLGRGEYYATPLEDLLPVETDTRQRLLFTRAKLLFVIDHSGSMSEDVGETTKQLAAMRGVLAAIPELSPLDEVGIMSFDTEATWDLPFTSVRDMDKIRSAVSTMNKGGGTNLAVAMEEIIRGFGERRPTKRHAVILTDGLTTTADFRDIATRLSAIGVTVSTIGIGDEINDELLSNIAQWCGGIFYRAELDQIPTVIDKETIRMTRDLIQEGRIETRIASPSPVVEGLGPRLPPVKGYLITKAKSLSTVLIEARSLLSPDTWDPLLATRRYGAGNVAVFAADSGRRWLSSWSGSSAYNRLWGQTLRAIIRAAPDRGFRAVASVEGGNARVVVEAIGEDGRSLSGLRLIGTSTDELSAPFSLEETAPGRYEGFAPLTGPGLRGFEVRDPVSGSWTSTWAWNPPGAELSRLGPDEAALSLIAGSTGGRHFELGALKPSDASIRWASFPLRTFFMVLALILLLADLFVRSAMQGRLKAATAAVLEWWSAQKSTADSMRSLQWAESAPSQAQSDELYQKTRRKLAAYVSRRSGFASTEETRDE